MAPVVIALAADQRYFPGLHAAVASALSYLDRRREVDLKVLDGGISEASKKLLSDFVERSRRSVRLEFVSINPSVFGEATLGPGESHMTYYRTLLPHLLDVPRLIYLDCDVLVFRDLSKLLDRGLSPGKILAAVRDSETLTLEDDSRTIAEAMNLPATGCYFNAGVALLNLDEFRNQNFTERALEFFKKWKGHYRFWDQSAINFLLHGKIDELPEYWNRASWRFDVQQDNELSCVLHYTTSAPWLGGTPGPAQVLFERFAAEAGFPVNQRSSDFKRSSRRNFWRNALAPVRALAFPIEALLYRIAGNKDKSADYEKVGRYWLNYIRDALTRRRLYRRRNEEIIKMKFELGASPIT